MKKWFLVGIIFLAFVLRVYSIDKYPTGFTPDEASFGYDAYSLLKTGKDQWGNSWPIVLQSFGDYKAPLYSYLTIPSVAVFGLTKFATRLPNALLGTAAVYVLFLLTNKLLEKNKQVDTKIGLLASLLLAVSPWHIMLSRGAFEANLTTFFLPLGIYLFLSQKYKLSALVLGLNLFTYHSAKFVTPLIVAMLVIIYWKRLSETGYKKLVAPFLIFSALVMLTAYSFLNGAGARAAEINIFKGSLEQGYEERFAVLAMGENPTVARILHNKFTVSVDRFVNNYLQYFSPHFYLTNGPSESTYGMLPGRGVSYWFELLGILLSLVFFASLKSKKYFMIAVFWILVAAVPASLTVGPGYAGNRAAIMLPGIQMLAAVGIYYLLNNKKYLYILFSLLMAVSLVRFCEEYFVYSPFKAAPGMLYGRLEVFNYLKDNYPNENVVVNRNLSEAHIYYAFVNKIDPKDYASQTQSWGFARSGLTWVDQLPSYTLNNIIFTDTRDYRGENIIVSMPEDAPKNSHNLHTINYPDGKPAVVVSRNNEEI